MSKNLVIVESPAKAKTIAGYLGDDFTVMSSVGHIRGLPSKNGSVDVANNYAPKYEVSADKKKVITELKKAVKAADTVWLASDEDREGEAIAWHLAEVLGLDPATTKRIAFHEITKQALAEAIKNPRTINMNLVDAQQARQSLDYLVGFELSPVLWRKVAPKLSAGRVQSVAVRLVVEREQEIDAHTPESTYKISANFTLPDGELPAEASKKFNVKDDVRTILNDYATSDFTVSAVTKKPGTRNPSAPFTTSTIQQEASNKLGFSPRTTMQLAQRLYEAGHITYMRTDSLNLSKQSLAQAADYITSTYGEQYHQFRTFKAKSAGAQEAHEAIRPTSMAKTVAGADERQKKLYNLIWRRTLASQMAPAATERTTMTITPSQSDQELQAKGEIVTFDGFMKVYGRAKDDVILPELSQGDSLSLINAQALESLSRGPARYTEASLVKKLEEMGIGRPSTYASTIATIQNRDYVEKADIEGVDKQVNRLTLKDGVVTEHTDTVAYGKDANKLTPTDTGIVVTDFLTKYFSQVIDYDFTRKIETQLDEVADDKKDGVEVIDTFYKPFHGLVEATADVSKAEANQARELGMHPKTGRPIYARFGRFGPMFQMGDKDDEEKPQFAPMPKNGKIGSVTLDDALKMFELPRLVGQTEDGKDMVANIGRFGPYIKVDSLFVSIKPEDPHTISLEKARELYADKLKKEAEKNIADFGDGLKVLNGRFGPYVTDGKKNAKIPKDTDPKTVTKEQAEELIAKAPAKKARRRKTK